MCAWVQVCMLVCTHWTLVHQMYSCTAKPCNPLLCCGKNIITRTYFFGNIIFNAYSASTNATLLLEVTKQVKFIKESYSKIMKILCKRLHSPLWNVIYYCRCPSPLSSVCIPSDVILAHSSWHNCSKSSRLLWFSAIYSLLQIYPQVFNGI